MDMLEVIEPESEILMSPIRSRDDELDHPGGQALFRKMDVNIWINNVCISTGYTSESV